MKEDVTIRQPQELLSALVDGELSGAELDEALALAEQAEGQESWQLYQLLGDVLRSPDLAQGCQHDVLTGLRASLAQEPPLSAGGAEAGSRVRPSPQLQAVAAPAASGQADRAANDALFRWKLAAGFASLAAVATVGWHLLAVQPVGGAGSQWAGVMPDKAVAQTGTAVMAVASQDGQTVVLRDPQLDALLASQPQYASRAGVQMPAEFLRNASLARAQQR